MRQTNAAARPLAAATQPTKPAKIIPIVLNGRAGTRLLPRASRPQPSFRYGGGRTPFQETLLRCRPSVASDIYDPRPIVVGADDHRLRIAEDLLELGIEADILLEPVSRDTCAAICAGCLRAIARDPGATVVVLPADHAIIDTLAEAVTRAAEDANDGYLVTFGAKPTHPASGYDYIQPGDPLKQASRVAAFVEKPSPEQATRLCHDGHLWNSGNFLFRAGALIRELRALEPRVLGAVGRAMNGATVDRGGLRLDKAAWTAAPSVPLGTVIAGRAMRAAVMAIDSPRDSAVANAARRTTGLVA